MNRNLFKKLLISVVFFGFSFVLFTAAITTNVMAPLKLDLSREESDFKILLRSCKELGVKAISVDVWWGLVESNRGYFDWTYYDSIFKMIVDAKLQIQPIMSFHACGGNVGDDIAIPIPSWIWDVAGSGSKYISEQHDPGNPEVVAVWAKNYSNVIQEYRVFMEAFQEHFSAYANCIQAINISCGPSGELRYPSYDMYTDRSGNIWGRGYPTRGYLQCYSEEAKRSFRCAMRDKYHDIASLNLCWHTTLWSFNEVNPPEDGNNFFEISNAYAYINAQYGKDFIEWYNGELIRHGDSMLKAATDVFSRGAFSNIDLEIKIPGIHWLMTDPNMPRSAEVCAGLLSNNFYIWSRSANPPGGSEYLPILNMAKSLDCEHGRRVLVYFTCLEMANGNPNSPPYSQPSALVFWIGSQAERINLPIKGENALAPNSGSTWDKYGFWWNIHNVLSYSQSYKGITILRMKDVCEQQRTNFQEFIRMVNEVRID